MSSDALSSSGVSLSTEHARVALGGANRGKLTAYAAFAMGTVEELSAKNGEINARPTSPFSIAAQTKKEEKPAREEAERRAQAQVDRQAQEAADMREADRVGREGERGYFVPYHG